MDIICQRIFRSRPGKDADLHELTKDFETFTPDHLNVDDDFVIWFSLILKQLNVHAPLKTRRVKAKRLTDWFTPDITEMQRKRDTSRRLKNGTIIESFETKQDS